MLLAIETSCDETAVAIMNVSGKLMTSLVRSQDKEHAPYGGIVPEIASRAHSIYLLPMIDKALQQTDLGYEDLQAIAVTAGPGLLGSLLVGIATAKSLALGLNLPIIAIDHLEAHIAAAFIDDKQPKFPLLAIIVSGGHSAIYLLEDFGQMQLLGCTQDDAMGEAYDKIAAKLNLGYPGGPIIDQLAEAYLGETIALPIPMRQSGDLNLSFSGLKTATIQKLSTLGNLHQQSKIMIAASFQQAAVQTLMEKLRLAIKFQPQIKQLVVCGGVACNKALRREISELAATSAPEIIIPLPKYCTDNAAMIARLALPYFEKQKFSSLDFSPYTHASLSPSLTQS